MAARAHNFQATYCGLILIAALILGGGTRQFLWSDHLLQILLIPALFLGFSVQNLARLPVTLRWVLAAIFLVLVVQFLPVYRTFDETLGIDAGWGMFSPAPGKSLEAALFFVCVAAFFLMLSAFEQKTLIRLLRYLYLGLGINILLAVVQMSFPSDAAVEGILPFAIRLGVFANGNHFASLIFAILPLLAWQLIYKRDQPAIFGILAFLLALLQFAGGSTAAMGITTVLAIAVLPLFSRRKLKHRGILIPVLIVIASVAFALLLNRDSDALSGNQRVDIYLVTLSAISEYWLVGSGLGSFVDIFPIFEPKEMIGPEYINHAHSDFLELLLELGLVFVLLFAGYMLALLRSYSSDKFQLAAMLGIAAVLLHSVVDYPLRTMAVAMLFAFLNAIVFCAPEHSANEDRTRRRR